MLGPHASRLTRLLPLALAGAICPLHGALTMKIDVDNDLFYVEGSDSGNGTDFGFGTYDVQFYYDFATEPSASTTISNSPRNLFNESGTISSSGMNLIRNNGGLNYVFIDLSSNSDITTLSGKGPSGSISYAHLPTADQTLFESMIGQSMILSIGTGYSAMAVQAVPEPATIALLTGTLAGLICWRRRRRS